jgi:hypothetical protein
MLLQPIFTPHLKMAVNLLKYEVTGLEDCSREIEVRFWWKKSLHEVLPVLFAGGLREL